MDKQVCEHYLKGKCRFGNSCKYLHFNSNIEENIVLITAEIHNGSIEMGSYRSKIIGIDIPFKNEEPIFPSAEYYISNRGYKIVSIIHTNDKVFVHMEKINTYIPSLNEI